VSGDEGVIAIGNAGSDQAFLTAASTGRVWDREAAVRPIF